MNNSPEFRTAAFKKLRRKMNRPDSRSSYGNPVIRLKNNCLVEVCRNMTPEQGYNLYQVYDWPRGQRRRIVELASMSTVLDEILKLSVMPDTSQQRGA